MRPRVRVIRILHTNTWTRLDTSVRIDPKKHDPIPTTSATSRHWNWVPSHLHAVEMMIHRRAPSFRVNMRIFCLMPPGEPRITVKLDREDQLNMIEGHPGVVTPANSSFYSLHGWTYSLALDKADEPLMWTILAWTPSSEAQTYCLVKLLSRSGRCDDHILHCRSFHVASRATGQGVSVRGDVTARP